MHNFAYNQWHKISPWKLLQDRWELIWDSSRPMVTGINQKCPSMRCATHWPYKYFLSQSRKLAFSKSAPRGFLIIKLYISYQGKTYILFQKTMHFAAYCGGKISVKWLVFYFLPLVFGSKSGKRLHSVLLLLSVRNKANAPQNLPPPHSTHHSASPPLPANNKKQGNRSTDGLSQNTRLKPLHTTYSIS